MPKIIAHALTGATVIVAFNPKINLNNLTPLFVGMLLAVSPDFDILLGKIFNVSDLHRGLTHSLLFSIFVGMIITLCVQPVEQRMWVIVAYTLAYLSHPLLDLVTSTAGGVKLFYPFSGRFYHLGLTGIFELPIGKNFSEILAWCKIETIVFLPIFLLAVSIKWLVKYCL